MRMAFILSEIGIGLRRNLSMVISVVLVMFVSLTFVGTGVLLQRQIDAMKDFWYDRVQVSVFLCSADSEAPTCAQGAVTDAQREAILADLESETLAPYVDEVFYESKEEAFERFTEQFSDTAIVDNVTPEQMPESFRISLDDPEEYEIIAQVFSGREGVEQVQDQRELLDTLFSVLNRLTVGALAFAGVMLVAAVLLTATTIRLSAFSRRRETGIMRLVGASAVMLQLPFLLEGMIAASVGALMAAGALYAGVHFGVEGWLVEALPVFNYVGTADVLVVAPWLVLLGIVLAGVSSVVTLSRYLRV